MPEPHRPFSKAIAVFLTLGLMFAFYYFKGKQAKVIALSPKPVITSFIRNLREEVPDFAPLESMNDARRIEYDLRRLIILGENDSPFTSPDPDALLLSEVLLPCFDTQTAGDIVAVTSGRCEVPTERQWFVLSRVDTSQREFPKNLLEVLEYNVDEKRFQFRKIDSEFQFKFCSCVRPKEFVWRNNLPEELPTTTPAP